MEIPNAVKKKVVEAIIHFSIESWLYETVLQDLPEKSARVQELLKIFSSVIWGAWESIEHIDNQEPISRILIDVTELISSKKVSSSVIEDVIFKHLGVKINNLQSYEIFKFEIMERCVFQLIDHIKATSNIAHANIYFHALDRLLDFIAKLVFGENVNINNNLKKIIVDFDRVDDPATRDLIYKRIKEGTYQ
jgi:hypothetical protein